MNWDRRLILSGKYEDFWAHVHPLLKPGDRVGVLIPRAGLRQQPLRHPLLAARHL